MKPPVDPVLLKIGPVAIYWYGVLILAGVLLGTLYATRRAEQRGIDPEHIWNGLTACVILGIVGARIYHVFSTPAGCTAASGYACGWPWYRQHPWDAFKIWEGGLGIYGAVIGGALGVVLYARRHALSALDLLDIGAPGLALGQAIGRWGNFINQELYGPPTGSDWFGIFIPFENRLVIHRDLPPDTLFHPTFLYASLWCLMLFIVLALAARRWKARLQPGDVFAGYVIGYPLGRFWITFFRPDAWMLGPLATAQWIAILAVLAGVAFIVWRHQGSGSPPEEPVELATETESREVEA